MIFKGFIVTKMLSTHTHVTSFSVSVSVYDYESLSLSLFLCVLSECVCVCVCVCVCSSEFMDETLLSMGVYLVNSAHTQLYVSLVQTVWGRGGGALTWYFTSFIYMKIIQYCSTLIGVSKNLHKQCCFFIIWSRGSPRRIYAEM